MEQTVSASEFGGLRRSNPMDARRRQAAAARRQARQVALAVRAEQRVVAVATTEQAVMGKAHCQTLLEGGLSTFP